MTIYYNKINFKALKLLMLVWFGFLSYTAIPQTSDTVHNIIKTESVSEKYPDLKYDDYAKYLAKLEKKKKNSKNIEPNFDNQKIKDFFTVLGWIFISIIVSVILYFIIKNKGINIFNKSDKKIIVDADIEKNIHEVDLDTLLNNAIKNNQQELVIRFYFLKFLKNLANKNYIKWDADKTNSDYLYEIKNTNLKSDFEYASYLYTYIWYGKFEITPELFQKAQQHFKTITDRY